MIPDKDRPSTWVSYRNGLCDSCEASCCHMPIEVKLTDFVRLGLADAAELSAKKVGKRLSREGYVRSFRAATGLFLLQPKSDGSCPFLGADKRCTVYERRPDVCRGFPLSFGPRVGSCPYKRKAQK